MIDKNYAFKCVATNHYYGAMHDNATAITFVVTRGNLTLSILNAILRPSFSPHSTLSAFEVFYQNALYKIHYTRYLFAILVLSLIHI